MRLLQLKDDVGPASGRARRRRQDDARRARRIRWRRWSSPATRSGAAAGWTTSCASPKSTCGSNTTPSSARARFAFRSTIPIPRTSSSRERASRISTARPRATRCIRAARRAPSAAAIPTRCACSAWGSRAASRPRAGSASSRNGSTRATAASSCRRARRSRCPSFAITGGEEAEIVGVYVVDDQGMPRRIGFVLGNEFSDHGLEEQNYLYAAPRSCANARSGRSSCWATCRIRCAASRACCAPAKRCGKAISRAARTTCRIRSRTSSTITSSIRCSGARDSSTATSSARPRMSYAAGVRTAPDDVFKLDVPVFGRPLRNTLRRAEPETFAVEPL